MSVMRNASAGPLADEDADDADPSTWMAVGTTLRLIVGWASVAIGALNLIVEIDRPSGSADGPYLIFHAVWLVGGMVLLALAWLDPQPAIAGYVTGVAVTLGGLIVSALPATTTVCCVSAYAIRHGYPFTLLAHNAGGGWHVDVPHALADLMFWAFLGLIALVTVSLLRGVTERTAVEIPEPPTEVRQYIEHLDHAEEQAAQKTVGPLP